MAKEYVIDVYFVDDDDLYLNYFRKRFQLDLPHNLHTYNSGKTFIRHFVQDSKKRKNQKIVILDYLLKTGDERDSKTGMELLPMIKHHAPDSEVIILSGRVNYNIKPTAGNYTPVAFVKKDDNAFDHLSATIKRLAAKYEMDKRQRQSKFSLRIFLLALLLAILTFTVMYFIRNG
ncbi:MAG TPA: response regulator [Bacteroidales bacterium]|nr:response regulator [Bacteroidales bacterium]